MKSNNIIFSMAIRKKFILKSNQISKRLVYSKSYYYFLSVLVLIIFNFNCNDNTEVPIITINEPTLISPQNETTVSSLTPKFSWSPVANAKYYCLNISSDSLFSNIIFTDSLITNSELQLNISLDFRQKYFWRVAAQGDTKLWGPFSGIGQFSTPMIDPNLQQKNIVEITIYTIHKEKNEKDSVIINSIPYILPIPKWLTWSDYFRLSQDGWKSEKYDIHYLWVTNSRDKKYDISAQVSSNGKILEKLIYSETLRDGNELTYGGPIYRYTAYVNIENLPFLKADNSSCYFRVDGVSSQNYIKSFSYTYNFSNYWKNENTTWQYLESQWNDSSFIQIKFTK